jgi:uncharacterized membrane protein SpoIIM required for sporulation
MKLTTFVEERQARWERLESALAAAGRRPERLAPAEVLALARDYRAAAADLASARRHFPDDPMVANLERLVARARGVVYERPSRRANLVDLFADRYWLLLAERAGPLLLAGAMLAVPAVLSGVWAASDPETVATLLPAEFQWVAEAGTTDRGLGPLGLAGFSTFVFVNNIRVALLSFALGITWGIGTGLLLAYNGFILGGVGGLAIGAGNGSLLTAAVVGHGVLELTCIVVAGGAGLAVARAMLRPGHRTRRSALAAEAPVAMTIAAATAPWLVLAGLVEGYVSRVGLGPGPTTAIGVALGAVFWGLFWWRGWRPFRAGQSRARDLAVR